MCLTAEALALFLNMIATPEITTEPGRIVIHAETRDAHWIAIGDEWCTTAPQIDRTDRSASWQDK